MDRMSDSGSDDMGSNPVGVTCWGGAMEQWCLGAVEYWSIGVRECWSGGEEECWMS